MDYKDKIAWLSRYIVQVEPVRELIIRTNNTLTSTPISKITDMPTGGGGKSDKIGNGVCNLDRLKEFAWDTENNMIGVKIEIERAIMTISHKEINLVLANKYINGMTYRQVAQSMKYSIRAVKEFHRQGVEMLVIA